VDVSLNHTATAVVAKRVAIAPAQKEGGDEFLFEIGHRRRGANSGVINAKSEGVLEHDDTSDIYGHDDHDRGHESRKINTERDSNTHKREHKQKSFSSSSLPHFPIHTPRPNYHDPEYERTQLASWLKQCPSLQTVRFLSGAEWCFLAEGAGGGFWINSYD